MSRLALGLVLVVSLASATAGATRGAESFASARTLRARLLHTGRAEVAVVHTLADDLGGSPPRRARLAIEPPDRVRLEFPDDGECLTVRADGGEWLQPQAEQLLLLPRAQVAVAAGLWSVLLGADGASWNEQRTGPARYVITPKPGSGVAAPFLRLELVLGADGLPKSLTSVNGNERLALRFSGWRFTRPRGTAAFRLAARPGITTVPMR